MEYMPQVRVSKEDFLALSDLAGDMSIMDYMSKVIREHVSAQKTLSPDACPYCLGSGKGKMSGIEVGCMFCSSTGKIK